MYLPQSTAIRLIAYTIGGTLSRAEKARYEYYTREYSDLVATSNSAHHAISAQAHAALEAGDRAFLRVQSTAPTAGSWVDIINGSRYTWAMLRDRFGVPTILEDNPGWTAPEDVSVDGKVSSLDEADMNTIYMDTDGDLWMQDDSDANNWVCYQLDGHIEFESGFLAPLEPVARKVNK